MKRSIITCTVAVLALAGLSAVNIVPKAKADGHVLKIGMPLAMTGGLADEGKKQIDVWKLWLDKINAAGGFKVGGKNMSIEMIQYDDQTDGKRAQQLAEKLITDDKVDVLMAPFGSGPHFQFPYFPISNYYSFILHILVGMISRCKVKWCVSGAPSGARN